MTFTYLVVDRIRNILINKHIRIDGSFQLISQMVEDHFQQLMIVVGTVLNKMITNSIISI